MTVYFFKNWKVALDEGSFGVERQKSYRITINGYLGYLKQSGQKATIENARAFIKDKVTSRRPSEQVAQSWKDALNWFFKNAPTRRQIDGRMTYGETVRDYQQSVEMEPMIREAIRVMRIRHMSLRTEENYIGWIRRWDAFNKNKRIDQYEETDLKEFLSHIAVHHHVSVATQKQALNAGVFLLREVLHQELGDFSDYVSANPRKYFPVVYSQKEIVRLLENIRGKYKLMACLQYGCGLRVSELCSLRVKDIDFDRDTVYIRAGKGCKDRIVTLPRRLKESLCKHMEDIKGLHTKDRRDGLPGVYIPNALKNKYPNADSSWQWFWLFPSSKLSEDPRAKPNAPMRRHHVLPAVYQKHLSEAAKRAKIHKRSNSHILRHSYATHHLENGTTIREVQELMGHAKIETTMIYLHVMNKDDRKKSPIDCLI